MLILLKGTIKGWVGIHQTPPFPPPKGKNTLKYQQQQPRTNTYPIGKRTLFSGLYLPPTGGEGKAEEYARS